MFVYSISREEKTLVSSLIHCKVSHSWLGLSLLLVHILQKLGFFVSLRGNQQFLFCMLLQCVSHYWLIFLYYWNLIFRNSASLLNILLLLYIFYPNGGLRIFKRKNKGLRYKHNSTGYTSKKTQQRLSNGIGKYKWIFHSGE